MITWQRATDALTQVEKYEVSLDGRFQRSFDDAYECAELTCSLTMQQPIADGDHTLTVTAVDVVGHRRDTTQHFRVVGHLAAAITASAPVVGTDEPVLFDAGGSTVDNGTISRYEWDLDGDGSYETDGGSQPTISRAYSSPRAMTVGVRVTTASGRTAVALVPVEVRLAPPQGPVGVSINSGAQFTNDPKVTLAVTWPRLATGMFAANDGGFRPATTFGVSESVAWTLDSSGPERLPKTVYLRFSGGSAGAETYQDDIILDQTPPEIVSVSASGVAPVPAAAEKAVAAAKRRPAIRIKLKASDPVSGVAAVFISDRKGSLGERHPNRRSLTIRSKAKRIYVTVRDHAGNQSRPRRVKVRVPRRRG